MANKTNRAVISRQPSDIKYYWLTFESMMVAKEAVPKAV